MKTLEIGKLYRCSRPYNPTAEKIDGLPNYFYQVVSPKQRLPTLDKGINPIALIRAVDGIRCPAILISSSPHKVGSLQTPWQDLFDVDNGYIRYFGDNKHPGRDPSLAKGNKALIKQRDVHESLDQVVRRKAVPILFFRRIPYEGRLKGNVVFQGLGVVQRAELITEYDLKKKQYFSNWVFEFAVLSLSREHEAFDWDWITARRDKRKTLEDANSLAPQAGKYWLQEGPASVEKYRRQVSKSHLAKKEEQLPLLNSREQQVLTAVTAFYAHQKSHFELLASLVVKRMITCSGGKYIHGWVTPQSGDHGADFIGRVDLGGNNPGKVKIIVFGQAKCEQSATSGRDIARTAARLKRGWIGAYVTTSYFSERVQQEIIEDEYPILLINGLQLAREVDLLTKESGCNTITEYLERVDNDYGGSISRRRPEEVLLD